MLYEDLHQNPISRQWRLHSDIPDLTCRVLKGRILIKNSLIIFKYVELLINLQGIGSPSLKIGMGR